MTILTLPVSYEATTKILKDSILFIKLNKKIIVKKKIVFRVKIPLLCLKNTSFLGKRGHVQMCSLIIVTMFIYWNNNNNLIQIIIKIKEKNGEKKWEPNSHFWNYKITTSSLIKIDNA